MDLGLDVKNNILKIAGDFAIATVEYELSQANNKINDKQDYKKALLENFQGAYIELTKIVKNLD